MSAQNDSDSSTSESEVSACSSNYNPLKVLYSSKAKIPVKSAPLYENVQQYESAQIYKKEVLPVGLGAEVKKREESKAKAIEEEERKLEEKNKQRFANFAALVPAKEKRYKNVLTRIEGMQGPLSILKECVDKRLRIKVITRHGFGIRGYLTGTLVAFDKQWNLAMTDVLEVWTKKATNKRKIPPGLGTPVPRGTAAKLFPVPAVTERDLGGGLYECTRHLPQILVRGEHVVLINTVDR